MTVVLLLQKCYKRYENAAGHEGPLRLWRYLEPLCLRVYCLSHRLKPIPKRSPAKSFTCERTAVIREPLTVNVFDRLRNPTNTCLDC